MVSQPFNLLNVDSADGIINYSEEVLASDPSLIVGHPYPPGSDFFYVDDVKQIRAGCRIFYSTTAENYPGYVMADVAALHRARNEKKKYHAESPLFAHWAAEELRLEKSVQEYYQGNVRIKSMRTVVFVDPVRNLIRVNKSFKYSYQPRILGGVVRVVGFTDDMINEIATDRMEKGLKKHYGNNWESDALHYGIPDSRATG